jgi:hypothetical protein
VASQLVLSPLRAILYGALIVGVLDALDAIIVFGLRSGATPIRIFQSIASGALGPAAYSGGVRSALVGVLLHFLIAALIVTTYVVVSARVPALRRRPLLYGPLFGVVAYFVMNLVVIPLSAIGGAPTFTVFGLTNGLLIHIFGVGLPAALLASRVPTRGEVGS